MARVERAILRPSKIEIIVPWLTKQTWFEGSGAAEIRKSAGFRFDDPDGRVGIETLLVSARDKSTLQVPLTYRDHPLRGAESFLLGTMEHSVLGTRFVYDAVGDPAYIRAIVATALEGGTHADEYADVDGTPVLLKPSANVVGSGTSPSTKGDQVLSAIVRVHEEGSVSVISAGFFRIALARIPGESTPTRVLADQIRPDESARIEILTGSWTGHSDPAVLAAVGISTDER